MRRVEIVGAEIAGLTLAAALDPERFAVTLREAEPERRGSGAVLVVWPAARRALERPGGWGRLAGRSVPAPALSLLDLSGRRLLTAPVDPGLVLVDRPALLEALEAVVPGGVERVTGPGERPAALDADLVVGADGVRSVVRPLVDARAATRRATPYVALRAVVDAPPTAEETGEYWGTGRLFGVSPAPGERTYWFASWRSAAPEPVEPLRLLAEATEQYAGCTQAIFARLAAAPEDVLASRVWTTPAMRRYVHGRYVVIGDAAHASTPNLGRGACDAILDAVSLAAALNAGAPFRGAACSPSLLAWQARRLPATTAVRWTTGGVMRLAVTDRGHDVRDVALRGVGRVLDAGPGVWQPGVLRGRPRPGRLPRGPAS